MSTSLPDPTALAILEQRLMTAVAARAGGARTEASGEGQPEA